MASKHWPSKNGTSSIRYWWIPLDSQPDNAFNNGDVHLQPESHAKNCKQPETKYSSNRLSTAQFVSAVAGIWDCVGQPAVFQTKSSLKYGEAFPKDSIICYSDSSTNRPSSSVGGDNLSGDLTSRSCSSSSAKSNFEDLKTIKRMLCFASCNRNINNLSILSVSQSNLESSGLGKAASIEGGNDLAYKYGSMITKPYFGLEDQAKLARNGCHDTAESITIGKTSNPANQSSSHSTGSSSAIEGEDYSGGQNVKIVENVLLSPVCTTYSLQSPVTSTNETIIISTSPNSDIHSIYSIGALTSAEWTLGQCQQPTDAGGAAVESSAEVSTIKGHMVHEKSKSLIREDVIDEVCSTRHWLSVQDKLQVAFSKNKHALAGVLSGTLVSLCLHPVDTLKTVIQANGAGQKSTYDILRSIISERGLLGLYCGIASNIASSAPISAIYTCTYESVKGALLPILPKEYHSFAHCIAGGCSSIATSFVFTHSERIKQQMQVGSQYQNCWNALIGSLEKGGLPSLYAGWGAVLCRNIPHSIIKFYACSSTESLKQFCRASSKDLKSNANLSTLQTYFLPGQYVRNLNLYISEMSILLCTFHKLRLVCGGLVGSTAALFTTPFDVVKTRLQTQVPGSFAKYDGVLHALQEIAREEGLQGLYRGLTPRLAMYVSQGAIFFASYEFLKAVLSLETPRAPLRVIQNKEDADSAPSRLQKLTS